MLCDSAVPQLTVGAVVTSRSDMRDLKKHNVTLKLCLRDVSESALL